MDTSERQNRIFVKANANSQRRKREAFLSATPRSVADYLAQCECVVTPDAGNWLSRILPITKDGIGAAPQHRPVDYRFAAFGWPEKAIASLGKFLNDADNPAESLLSLWPPPDSSFAGQKVIVPPLPLFAVDFQWVVRHFNELWDVSEGFLAAFVFDISVGFVVDSYCGLLEGDLNPAEIAYEVGFWGHASAD
jgi:hypothetical protein